MLLGSKVSGTRRHGLQSIPLHATREISCFLYLESWIDQSNHANGTKLVAEGDFYGKIKVLRMLLCAFHFGPNLDARRSALIRKGSLLKISVRDTTVQQD